ncbi:hypothetical protein F5880DRAFT_1507164 [Lentinula raphanica]|nr:hypothetical protein F5880DRAFT_1507164 [Lentinula raphanica]
MHANESNGSSPGIVDALRRSLTLNGGGLGRSKSDLSQSKSLAAKITPFNPDSTTDGDGPRQGTVDSHVLTTTTTPKYPFVDSHVSTTPKYPFTRPNMLTLRTQTQSVIRGTVYDLQSLSSAGTSVPAGIHDLDEDVVKNRGKPLPVADSELMRTGMRRENSIGAAGLLGLSSSTSLLSRQDSADSHYAEPVHGRRPSVSSAVLLGGTGPVGPCRNLSTNSGNRTTTYHPDLDEVVDVRGGMDDVEDDLADVREEDLQGEFISVPGHELPSPTSTDHNDFPRSISHASQPSLSTIATSSYPHTIITKGGSPYGLGLALPQASTSTVYVGILGHLMRVWMERDQKGKRLSRNSTLATTYEGFEDSREELETTEFCARVLRSAARVMGKNTSANHQKNIVALHKLFVNLSQLRG